MIDINNESGVEVDELRLVQLAAFALDQLRIHPQAELSIRDEGGAPAEAPQGVSRTLMTAFARQLGGTLSFETPAAGGLITSLAFPTPEEIPRRREAEPS